MAAMRRMGRHCKLAAMIGHPAIRVLALALLFASLGCHDALIVDSGVADAMMDGASDATPDDAGGAPCTAFADAVVVGNAENPDLDEVSGVAASRSAEDVLWVHNDSGDLARIFALRTDGTNLGEYRLTGATNVDWEDIAIGPGPEPGRDYIYVGDIGDNDARDTGVGRATVVVYQVPEPAVTRDQAAVTVDLGSVVAIPLVYPAGPHDCEALMVDPDSGDLFLLTKDNDGMSELYVARAPLGGATITLERVGMLLFGPGATPGGPLVTAADLSVDGRALLVRTYSAVLLFLRPAGGSVADALGTTPFSLPAAFEMQGEGIAWAPDGRGYYTTSEFVASPIHFYAAEPECAP